MFSRKLIARVFKQLKTIGGLGTGRRQGRTGEDEGVVRGTRLSLHALSSDLARMESYGYTCAPQMGKSLLTHGPP